MFDYNFKDQRSKHALSLTDSDDDDEEEDDQPLTDNEKESLVYHAISDDNLRTLKHMVNHRGVPPTYLVFILLYS